MPKEMDKGWECLLQCPTCGVAAGLACRTPKGRKKTTCHDTRPFFIPSPTEEEASAENLYQRQ